MADPSKTEKATPRRRQEFRKKGSIAKSAEINTTFVLFSSILILKFGGKYIYLFISDTLKFYLSHIHTFNLETDDMANFFIIMFSKVLIMIVPAMIILFFTSVLANLVQVGFLLTTDPIKPNIGKLNIIKGIQNLISKKSLENLVKAITKVSIIGYLAYITIRDNIPQIIDFFNLDLNHSFLITAQLCFQLLVKIIIAFIVISALDYIFQRYTHEEKMKMTKQEIKEEYKRMEGDPLIKGAIRRRQQEMARRRMMSEVPKADVVVTNPFHVAVAIKYDARSMKAPIVLAKGIGRIAESIRKIAEENNVPIIENPPVARALYKSSTVGKVIPADMYSAIADILTQIYRLSGKTFGI